MAAELTGEVVSDDVVWTPAAAERGLETPWRELKLTELMRRGLALSKEWAAGLVEPKKECGSVAATGWPGFSFPAAASCACRKSWAGGTSRRC